MEERHALLRKRECADKIDIHRRAKRRRVAFAEEPDSVLFQMDAEPIRRITHSNNFALPPAQKNRTPPAKAPAKLLDIWSNPYPLYPI